MQPTSPGRQAESSRSERSEISLTKLKDTIHTRLLAGRAGRMVISAMHWQAQGSERRPRALRVTWHAAAEGTNFWPCRQACLKRTLSYSLRSDALNSERQAPQYSDPCPRRARTAIGRSAG